MKRWISILLIASLLFTFLPTGGAAQAEPTAATHSHDGWTALYSNSSVFKGQDPLNAGKYYLTGNVDATGFITINGDVTLCLNGNLMDLKGKAIKVGSGDHLTICDCSSATHYGNIGTDGLWQASALSGSCNLTGGIITSTGSDTGNSSAVSVTDGGSLTLVSGNIAGSTAGSNGGGGVFVYGSNSSFTMEGGSIIGNRAVQKNGGGVSVVSGSFTMTGGSIANNTASGNGGGYGGGVCVESASFTMEGGSISGNSATQWGGGVYVNNSSFTMEGGSISGNTASSGGGVSVNSSGFTMSGGNITGNQASGGVGGGVTLNNNSSSTSMTLSGDVDITSNTTAANAPSNVYLPQSGVITIGGPLTGSQNIGVSMAQPGIFTSGLPGNGSLANFTSDDSDYSLLLDDGEAALHAHSYSYFAEGAVITQKCICGHHATATLSAPTDLVYDGQAKNRIHAV